MKKRTLSLFIVLISNVCFGQLEESASKFSLELGWRKNFHHLIKPEPEFDSESYQWARAGGGYYCRPQRSSYQRENSLGKSGYFALNYDFLEELDLYFKIRGQYFSENIDFYEGPGSCFIPSDSSGLEYDPRVLEYSTVEHRGSSIWAIPTLGIKYPLLSKKQKFNLSLFLGLNSHVLVNRKIRKSSFHYSLIEMYDNNNDGYYEQYETTINNNEGYRKMNYQSYKSSKHLIFSIEMGANFSYHLTNNIGITLDFGFDTYPNEFSYGFYNEQGPTFLNLGFLYFMKQKKRAQ